MGNDPTGVKFTGPVWENSANESNKIDSSAFPVRILLFFLREKKGLIRREKLPSQKTWLKSIAQKRPFYSHIPGFSVAMQEAMRLWKQ